MQLDPIVPSDRLIPQVRQDAREPEAHLDDVLQRIIDVSPSGPPRKALGVSAKDISFLSRLAAVGTGHVSHLDPAEDLEIEAPTAYIESIQRELRPGRMSKLKLVRGEVDLVVARHIFEHTEDPRRFVQGLLAVLAPAGKVLIEVPDSSHAFFAQDYCIVWEEHSMYFSQATLRSTLELCGLRVLQEFFYPRVFEGSIVALCERNPYGASGLVHSPNAEDFSAFDAFSTRFTSRQDQCRSLLETYQRRGYDIVMFGAGHLASAFIDFYGVSDLVRVIVDDTPEKIGSYLPGSRLPICASRSEWMTTRPTLILTAVSVESESVVQSKLEPLVKPGSKFASILVSSSTSLFNEA